jgi:hypothetical protein
MGRADSEPINVGYTCNHKTKRKLHNNGFHGCVQHEQLHFFDSNYLSRETKQKTENLNSTIEYVRQNHGGIFLRNSKNTHSETKSPILANFNF